MGGRQLGYLEKTPGFAPPPRSGFAFHDVSPSSAAARGTFSPILRGGRMCPSGLCQTLCRTLTGARRVAFSKPSRKPASIAARVTSISAASSNPQCSAHTAYSPPTVAPKYGGSSELARMRVSARVAPRTCCSRHERDRGVRRPPSAVSDRFESPPLPRLRESPIACSRPDPPWPASAPRCRSRGGAATRVDAHLASEADETEQRGCRQERDDRCPWLSYNGAIEVAAVPRWPAARRT